MFMHCAAQNSNQCFIPIADTAESGSFQGCVEGVGCVFTAIDCAVSQPIGPPDSCTEYYNDAYSGDAATNTCRATPE